MNKQTRFPAFCLKCKTLIMVEVRKVNNKDGRDERSSRRRTSPTKRNVVRTGAAGQGDG